MFYCERCGTGFNSAVGVPAFACPRCRAKDGVHSPLTFKLFDPATIRKSGLGGRGTPEEQRRRSPSPD